jgi:branched-chain amino acid transport system permease protein
MAAVRDRDIAAEIMGIPLARYKTIAFVVSSFYAGVAGALLYGVIGFLEPAKFGFGLSIEYIAMILIGGIATVSGSIMGALFIVFLPRGVEQLAGIEGLILPVVGGLMILLGLALFVAGSLGWRQRRFDLAAGLVAVGGLLLLSLLVSASAAGGVLTIEQFERILFGVFIIGFLIFEPLGLYGIWIRIRNYWKAWPFSY